VLACLILLTLHLRNASTPGSQKIPTTTATIKQPQPPLPASPTKPPVAVVTPVRVPAKSTHAPSQKKLQPIATDQLTDAAVAVPIAPSTQVTPSPPPIAPVSIARQAQLAPQTPESGKIVLRATATPGSLSGGGIRGTVTDPAGAVISRALVIATNTDTGVATAQTTGNAGNYTIQPLPVGTYNVEVVAKGFQRLLQENVNVDNATMAGLNMKLSVGGENTTITVTDAPPFLEMADATLGGTVENQLYTSLPLSMNGGPRDPTAFQYLMPGAQENVASNTGGGVTNGNSGIYGGTGQANLNADYVEGMPVSNIAARGSGTAVSNAVSAGAGAAGLASTKRLPTLPSKLPALSVVENASRALALDTAGALFLSDDAGLTWHSVQAQWQGRALALRLSQPRSAALQAPTRNTANDAEARPQTQTLALTVPAFELTTDSGDLYTSPDGQTWRRK